MLLICFGNLLGHWKWTLIASFVGMVFWGGMIGLVTPYNKGLMIAFTFLEQTFFGWAQYESVAFTQLGRRSIPTILICKRANLNQRRQAS